MYILQEPRVGQRAEFDWGEVHLNIRGICLKFYLAVFVCNPASPQENGTDEESVGYIRRVAFGERSSFESFEEAIEWLSTCLAEINTCPVYRRPNVQVQGLVQERELMNPLQTLEYENCELKELPYPAIRW